MVWLLLVVGGLAPAHAAKESAYFPTLWERKVPFVVPNDPILIDIDNDGRNEIVVSDSKGLLCVLEGATGEMLWSYNFDRSLTSPVAGHFWGDGSLDIAVADSTGFVHLVNGGDGRPLQHIDLKKRITLEMTVLPPPPVAEANGAIDYRPAERDRLLVIGDVNSIYCLQFGDPAREKPGTVWDTTLSGRIMAPASIGDVNGDGQWDVLVGVAEGRQGLLYVLNSTTAEPLPGTPENYPANITTTISSADIYRDGRDELFFGTSASELGGVNYQPERQRLWPLWPRFSTVQEPVSDPMLAPDGPSGWTVIIQTRNMLVARSVTSDQGNDHQAQASITSRAGLASSNGSGQPRVLFGDMLGSVMDWFVDGLRPRGSWQYRNNELTQTPLIADLDGKAGAECLLCFPREHRFRVVVLPDYLLGPGEIAWQARAGNLWRTGWRDTRYYQALRQRYDFINRKIEKQLRDAANASKQGQWVKAMAALAPVLDINPLHPVGRSLYRKAWVRDHLIVLLLAILASAALVGALAYVSYVLITRALALRRAADLTRTGKMDEAIDLYARLHRRYPKHAKTNEALARLLIQEDRIEPEFCAVFENASADNPLDAQLLRALSQCYVRAGSLTPQARDAHLRSLNIAESPEELKYWIGRSFLNEKRYSDAAPCLGEAIAEGFDTPAAYEALAQTQLETRSTDAQALPVLEKVRPAHAEDARFLNYLCEVYLANSRSDDTALQCAQDALAADPESHTARMLAIQILLDRGNAREACRRAEALYRENGGGDDVLLLVSRCLIALDRRDDEAVQILERALGQNPEDAQVLAHLSHVYFMRGWFDPHAAEIHRRAFEIMPEDDGIVEAMAMLAGKEGDIGAQAHYLEKLVRSGRESRKLMIELATVYRALGVDDDRARKPYEAAIQDNPDDPFYLAALGKIYVAAGETSPQATSIFGRLYEEHVEIPGLERQLILALDRNSDHDSLIDLCDEYLQSNPVDSAVRRIRARAYLATGQTRQAIDEYEDLLEEKPETDEVTADLALAYASAERTDERAIALYKSGLRIAPQQDALCRALAVAYARHGNIQEAIAQFRAALRIRKDCAEAVIAQCDALVEADSDRNSLRWFLCELLINCGRFREAIDHLRLLYNRQPEERARILEALGHILEADGENVYARRVRGDLYLRMSQLREARADLEEAHRLQPGAEDTMSLLRTMYETFLSESEDAELRFQLGQIYRATGDLDGALRCFQKSVRDYRFEIESNREMGRIFMDKGLLDLALEEFQKIAMDDPLKETVYQLGQAYQQRGDKAGARQAYRMIFATDAGFRDVQDLFETLSGESSGTSAVLDRTTIISQLSEKAKHRYKLLEEIGRGAMGIVYRAMDGELDEIVAIKILPDNLSTNSDALTRFRREARSARRLSHRNIVRIHDIGEEMGRKYISMEFVEGTTLKAAIRATGGLEPPRAVKYVCQVLDALAYAHSIGIVHRDIKPANIMISRNDEVKITDFGIAKILESTDATQEGAVVGTPLYMSPEQVRGEPVDHRADIYSVGILLYECIEGKPPFVKGDLAYSHLHVWPEPMLRGFSDINQIVMKALEKRKEDRWPSSQAMLDALRALPIMNA
jgi:tetratricopeptide (TPR) repeat protein